MAPAPITEDYYMVLEVGQTATPELVIRAYKRLAMKLHPDRNSKPGATEAFQLVCKFLVASYNNSFVDHQIIVVC
jgi:DnaJ-domain-containing protein 1